MHTLRTSLSSSPRQATGVREIPDAPLSHTLTVESHDPDSSLFEPASDYIKRHLCARDRHHPFEPVSVSGQFSSATSTISSTHPTLSVNFCFDVCSVEVVNKNMVRTKGFGYLLEDSDMLETASS